MMQKKRKLRLLGITKVQLENVFLILNIHVHVLPWRSPHSGAAHRQVI